jgi:hypothetical protein
MNDGRARFCASLIALIGAILGLPHVAWGQCPAAGSICDEYARTTLVFVADVEDVELREDHSERAQFRIHERFKGASATALTLVLAPSSEDLSLKRGQRLLVYANPRSLFPGMWSIACTRTKVLSAKDTEPAALRGLRDRHEGGVIDGSLLTSELLRAGRGGGIRVEIQRGKETVEILQTSSVGTFQTRWLTPGWYVLSARDPLRQTAIRHDVVVSRESRCISVGSIAAR